MSWKQAVNKPAAKPAAPKPKFETKDDDWDTDLSYENGATEKSQRYGSASVPGSGRVDYVDLNTIQDKMKTVDQVVKQDFKEKHPTRGYGGKFGTEQVMDKAAEGYAYKADVTKHSSQTDGKKGFGGEHGVDERPQDQSAVGFDYKPTVEKHSSQTDSSKGFGGKYGTDQNAQDKSAVGFAHKETVAKHPSQTDYTAGFGGKQEIEKEEPKKPSVTAAPSPPPKPSPKPAVAEKPLASGGAKADVGNIRSKFENPKKDQEAEKPVASGGAKADVGNIRSRFENLKKEQQAESAKRVAEERKKRAAIDQKLQEQERQSAKTAPTEVQERAPDPGENDDTTEGSNLQPGKTSSGSPNDDDVESPDNTDQ